MNNRTKLILGISILFGLVFLGFGIYQWYNLHQIEQGLREGSLSLVLYKIYEVAGKWGVLALYMPFSLYCFWKAYGIFKMYKQNEKYVNYDENNEAE